MRQDDTGFKLQPGAAEGLGVGAGPEEFVYLGPGRDVEISQSGGERNHLFLNQGDGQFRDVSGVATVDSPEDARSFAIFDYDLDGWSDMVVVNANAPATLLYRNLLGEPGSASRDQRSLSLRFVGANHGSEPAPGKSARDGYGAVALLDLGDTQILREHRCGEGLAAQNSTTLPIGLGRHETVERLRVRWPSGVEQELGDVPAGSLVTVFEDASQSPTGEAFVLRPFGPENAEPLGAPRAVVAGATGSAQGGSQADSTAPAAFGERLVVPGVNQGEGAPELALYTTMATWCASCRAELPELAHLRSAFAAGELGLYGVPVDEQETADMLRAYVESVDPAYELLIGLPQATVTEVKDRVNAVSFEPDALPASVVTDGAGRVLAVQLGAPSVSDLRRLLGRERAARAAASNGEAGSH